MQIYFRRKTKNKDMKIDLLKDEVKIKFNSKIFSILTNIVKKKYYL